MSEEKDIYKENYEMRKKIKEMSKSFEEISLMIVCMGGPLNDNALNYTQKQLGIFRDINSICEYNELTEDDWRDL